MKMKIIVNTALFGIIRDVLKKFNFCLFFLISLNVLVGTNVYISGFIVYVNW